MASQRSEIEEQFSSGSTPEDVAALYAWANLDGAKYRDYSASRREHRAQVRYLAAKALLDRELKSQAEAEAAADSAEREAAAAEARVIGDSAEENPDRFAALRAAEAAALKAAGERVQAARRAEAATRATVLAMREERELAEAHASATQQAAIYRDADELRKRLAGPQPRPSLTQEIERRTTATATAEPQPQTASEPASEAPPAKARTWKPLSEAILDPAALEQENLERSGSWRLQSDAVGHESGAKEQAGRPAWLAAPQHGDESAAVSPNGDVKPSEPAVVEAGETTEAAFLSEALPESSLPAATPAEVSTPTEPDVPSAVESAVDTTSPPQTHTESEKPEQAHAGAPSEADNPQVAMPIVAVFSPVQGVGVTSVVAAIASALAVAGEKVVLVDTSASAALALHFGGKELAPGSMRTYWPPDSTGECISLFRFQARAGRDDQVFLPYLERMIQASAGAQRVILDLSAPSSPLLRHLAQLRPVVLIPLTPAMESLKHVETCERLFATPGESSKPLAPYYLLNRFDAASPLHNYLRTRLHGTVGERLLTRAISDSAAVSEAFGEGSTVLEYAPAGEVAQQYRELAAWLKTISPPHTADVSTP
jgi:cellulose synthase operon protein YhjQ